MKVRKMFKVSDFFTEKEVINDGCFESLAAAKVISGKKTLCYALNYEYLNLALNNPSVAAIIVEPDLLKNIPDFSKSIIVCDEAELAYVQLKNRLVANGYLLPVFEYSIDSSAFIDSSADVSPKCKIGKNVIIGKNTLIKDYTIIEDDSIIGDNCTIGNEGLYFKRDKHGILHRVAHSGGVKIGNNVEVMNNSMIQRSHDADLFTTIGNGSKISVNVNIGHSSQIGQNNLISGNVQIAGRVIIGHDCWIGTSCTISDSIIIEDNVKIRIGSIVVKNVKNGQDVSGNFAYDHVKRIRNFVKEQR